MDDSATMTWREWSKWHTAYITKEWVDYINRLQDRIAALERQLAARQLDDL